MGQLIVFALMTIVQIVVVLHWTMFPNNQWLSILATLAGGLMAVMGLLSLWLLYKTLRVHRHHRAYHLILQDLAQVPGFWLAGLLVSSAFGAIALWMGVYWLVVILAVWIGAECAVTLYAVSYLARKTHEPS